VLLKIFCTKRDGIAERWRKLCNEEYHDLYTLPEIITMIISVVIMWVGHMAHRG
jgi:hypothetical protein